MNRILLERGRREKGKNRWGGGKQAEKGMIHEVIPAQES